MDHDIVIKGKEPATATVLICANPKHRTHHHPTEPPNPPDMKPQFCPEMFSLPSAFSTPTSSFLRETLLCLQMIQPYCSEVVKTALLCSKVYGGV